MPSNIDPSLLFDPSALNSPYNSSTTGGGNDWLSSALGGLGIGALFGSDSQWKPYTDANGNYVWNNPKHANPIPVSQVPGSSLQPNKAYKQTANNISALTALLPSLSNAINAQILPQQQAELQAAQATSPAYAQLMTQLYSQYAPQLANLGNSVNNITLQGTAQNLSNLLGGPTGQALTQAATNLEQQANPEFYAQRANTNTQLNNLYNSINSMLNGGLSTTENRELAQGLAQQSNQRGTSNAPSQLEALQSALQYGKAGSQRTQQEQSNLSSAIQQANNFLPASQTSFNPVSLATSGMSVSNPGTAQFTGINNGAQSAFGQVSSNSTGLNNNINTLQQQRNQAAQQNSTLNNWQNVLGSVTSGIGNILGGVAGGMI